MTCKNCQKMQSKIATQRNEIARITRKLEAATKEKLKLLNDIKWMRGETPENRHRPQRDRAWNRGSNMGEHQLFIHLPY